jgi:hypothetical protein
MGFPDDMGLDDEEATQAVSLFPPSERPTTNDRLRRTERIIKENPDYVIGKMMAEIVRLRHEVHRLNRGTNFGLGPFQSQRTSIRPQVQTAGISASMAALVTLIYQILHQAGILK